MKHLFLTIFVFIITSMGSANAQQAVLAAGQSVSGNGSVSYSIGQVVYTASSANQISVTQGVQQTYGSPLVSGLNEENDLQMEIYPNPTAEWVIIEFQEDCVNCSFQLFDENGKLLLAEGISQTETKISMNDLATGTYFLNVLKHDNQIQTSKIVKNNKS